jgi:hypothetical protein
VEKYVNDLRLGISVQNPVTFTGYSGLDPEFSNGNVLEFGIDGNSYPSPRIYMISLTGKF